MYAEMNKNELAELSRKLYNEYESYKSQGLNLDMSRGRPSAKQLDLANEMLTVVSDNYKSNSGYDCRNYGILDGVPEVKELFAPILGVSKDELIICGNSSLQVMYDTIARAMLFGYTGKPWGKCEKVKFLCPTPGYDRHFAICEEMGIEMIPVDYLNDGPDMDVVEKLVSEDDSIKGIWCVPKYSNPEGLTYSDEVVKRFANLSPKADDFRIFWDNAYVIHDITDTPDNLLNLLDECKKTGKEDMVIIFGSTSKISMAGCGISFLAGSKKTIDRFKAQISVQTIGSDKINQLRHLHFFKDTDGIKEHMKKHMQIIAPKFKMVLDKLESEIKPIGECNWKNPNGGYFISFNAPNGCAKRIVQLCKEAGVVMTPAGAAFPYGNDTKDSNIRIAPTLPTVAELED